MGISRARLRARVVYAGLGTAVEEGAAVVQDAGGDARLLFAGPAGEAERRWPDAEEHDVGFALSPPAVNAHTHLDLSGMAQVHAEVDGQGDRQADGGGDGGRHGGAGGAYEGFVRAVLAHGRRGARGVEAARQGVAELLAAGTNVVGDIVADEATMRFVLGHEELRGVAYWEVVAPDPADADAVFDATVERLRAFRAAERDGGVRVGLSPHAPHTVSAPLLQRFARLAAANDLPMQIHVAESPSELRLHRHGDGPLRELMGPLLRDWRPSGRSPVAYLDELGVLDARPTLVHGVHVDEGDVARIQRAGCVVVHCPRSNVTLGCGRFPWELYARHGATVAFGTDSRGSSPSLDVEEEVAAAVRLHGARANAGALVRAAVKGGHRALGLVPPRVGRGDRADALVAWHVAPDLAAPADAGVSDP